MNFVVWHLTVLSLLGLVVGKNCVSNSDVLCEGNHDVHRLVEEFFAHDAVNRATHDLAGS